MTIREAKEIIGKLGKEENYRNYIFQNTDYMLKVQKVLKGFAVLVWDLDDETTWTSKWVYGNARMLYEKLHTYGFIEGR